MRAHRITSYNVCYTKLLRTVSNTYGNDNSNKEIDVIADTDGSIVFIPWYGTIQYFIISSDGLLLVEFYTNYIIKHTLAIPFDLLSTTHKAVLPNINQLFTKYNPLSYITPNGLYYFRYIDISESPVTMWSTVTPGRIVNRILSDNGYGVYSLSAPFNYNESPLYPYLITNNIPDHTYSIRISNNGEHMYILRNPNNDVWFLEHYKLNPTQPFMVHFEWLQTSVNLNEFLYPGVSGSKIIHCELCVNPTGSELNLFLFSADSNNVVIDPSCIKRIPLNNYNIADINRVNIVTTPLKYRPVQNTGNKIFYLHSGNIEHIDIAPFDPPAETAEDILFNSKKLNDRTFVAVMDASFTLELGIKWSYGTGYYINIEFNGVVEPVLINADTTIIRNYNVTELSSLRISTSTISGNMEQSTYAITSIELVNAGVSRVFAKFPQPDPADKDMSLATLNLSGNKLNYASIDTIMDTIKPVSDIAYHAMLNIDLSGGTSQPPSYDTWEHIQTLKNNGATINHN